jgi:hypothetical protein
LSVLRSSRTDQRLAIGKERMFCLWWRGKSKVCSTFCGGMSPACSCTMRPEPRRPVA